MYTNGDRAGWLNAVASKIMDGGTFPPSIDRLNITVPPTVGTRESDGHCTAAAALGETARKDYKAGWLIIIQEMVALLRDQGFVGGNNQELTWIKPLNGVWKVDMPDGDRQLTIFGQNERRMAYDRMIVGERNEIDGNRVGILSKFESGKIQPLEIEVIGSRGGTTRQQFDLHPLALAIPPMTEAEREILRGSIERDGVKVPIVIYQGKILDGRNRGYYASVFKRPVRIETFEGTEAEARRHVAILNLHRRHLTAAQRYLAADNLFGAQAEKEAAEAMREAAIRGNQNRPPAVLKTAQPAQANGDGKSHERAAKLSADGGISNIKPSGMRAIKEVRDAPKTKARIESGEIQSVALANKEARIEKGLIAATSFQGVVPESINNRLGRCIHQLNTILRDLEMPVGQAPELIPERLNEIEALVPQVRQALRDQNIP